MTGLILVLVIWSLLILCWYVSFGLWLAPYRLFRRGQRKRDVAMLWPREFLYPRWPDDRIRRWQ